MRMHKRVAVMTAAALLLAHGSAIAADRPAPAAPAIAPDSTGTGPYRPFKQEIASLPDHVVYMPRDLSALGSKKLGLYLFGNGGCSPDGASSRQHLLEIGTLRR